MSAIPAPVLGGCGGLIADRDLRPVHFVGIGGCSMSGLAAMLHHQGYVVTGSDLRASTNTAQLKRAGIPVVIGHAPMNLRESTQLVVVTTAAVAPNNPEIALARSRHVPTVDRAQLLGAMMADAPQGIAIAGTSGKTTTTSLAARICTAHGATATVFDQAVARDLPESVGLDDLPALTLALGGRHAPDPSRFHLVIRSPGIPVRHRALVAAREAGIPIWGEIELAHRVKRCPLVAVTGTNGKGTTVALVAKMLSAAGTNTHEAGNMGIPLAPALARHSPDDVLVLEVSAAQLEDVDRFAPDIAVITNVLPEHRSLYRWPDYVAIKGRLVRNHTPRSATVVNYDDATATGLTTGVPGRILYTSTQGPLPSGLDGAWCDAGTVFLRTAGRTRRLLRADEIIERGALSNIPAAAAAAALHGAPDDAIRAGALALPAREHTVEFVIERHGVAYYNDAKSTNPWSLLHAVEAFPDRPLVLIAGGPDSKLADFTAVASDIMQNRRHLVLFGPTAHTIQSALDAAGIRPALTVSIDFVEATRAAQRAAQPGDAVVFSPGTHSWDMKPDYLARGREFKRLVSR